ncbi:MAG: chemotaxis protein CheD [Promethearchaeota archaeon]
MEQRKINLRMGEIVITREPEKYCILGLGSCIGVVIYDNRNNIFGIAHIVLPLSKDYKNILKNKNHPVGYYIDLAINYIVNEFKKLNITNGLNAKIVGGAQIFNNDPVGIGKKNISAIKDELNKYKIKLVKEFLGGNSGVSIYNIEKNGTLELRSNGKKFKI